MHYEFIVAGALAGGFWGLFIGLVPLFFAAAKNETATGFVAFLTTGIAGAVMGILLAAPVGALWLAKIAKR